MENKVLCSFPFNSIHNNIGLNYAPCCWAKGYISDKNPKNTLPLDHFDGEDFRRIRKEMINGERTEFLEKYCERCWRNEDNFGSSTRTSNSITETEIFENFDSEGRWIGDGRILNLKLNFFGNHCNLECYYCYPENSTARTSAIKKLSHEWEVVGKIVSLHSYKNSDVEKLNPEQFNSIVKQLTDNSHKISTIEICGGEPVLMKSHFKLLDAIIDSGEASNIELSYISNMTLMQLTSMKKYFDAFKHTYIQWSVDALGERNHWIRYPTDWHTTSSNAKSVQRYLNSTGKGEVHATMTPSILSITTFKETYDWLFCNDFIAGDELFLNQINRPTFLRSKHLPEGLKHTIAKKIKSISEFHHNELMSQGDPDQFLLAIKYFDDLDQSRDTNWRLTFPEIAEYAP